MGGVTTLLVATCLVASAATPLKSTATPLDPPSRVPVLSSPEDSSWTKSSDVTLEWLAVAGAVGYELRYAQMDDCMTLQYADLDMVDERFVATDKMAIAASEEPTVILADLGEGAWCWQVRSIVPVGGYSAWSEPRKVNVDTILPIVMVNQPFVQGRLAGTVDQKTTKLELTLDGEAKSDMAVKVEASPNSKGTYDWTLTLPKLSNGDHTYTLRAVDAAGNEKTTALTNFTVEAPISDKPTLVTSTQPEMLPLVPMGPLVFIASPVREEPTDLETIAPIIDTTRRGTMAVAAPARIEHLARSDVSVSNHPVQATEKGWLLFGIAWYWWVLGIGLSVTGLWVLLLRVRLATRLNWIGAV